MTAGDQLAAWTAAWLPRVEAALEAAVPSGDTPPASLHQAMRHSLFAGGKRLRPLLVLAAAEACGADPESALPAAAAVEMLHTYTLIHDDLPCMDDDDLRRGKPTCHVVFGEDIALLAGDALQALAFETLVSSKPAAPWDTGSLVSDLASASGSLWLVGGQVMDLEGEERQLPLDDLRRVHERKTGALLRCCATLGARIAGAPAAQVADLGSFGVNLGLAFQVIDDILDVTQTAETLGKTAGKDEKSGKSTYPALVGLEESERIASAFTEAAMSALDSLNERGARLRAFADKLLGRKN